MAVASKKTSDSRERVKKHREMLRASGLRPVTRWLPDTRNPEFIKRYRAQLAALNLHTKAEGQEFWDWVDKVQSTEGWE
jgi:hypothetical protein